MVTVKNQIAVFLLNQGAELQQMSHMIDAISKQTSSQSLEQIMALASGNEKVKALQKLASSVNVPWPKMKDEQFRTKQTSNWTQGKKFKPIKLNSRDLALIPGTFLNEDGSSCPILNAIAPGMYGVCLVDAENAAAWIQDSTILSTDEAAVVVLGMHCPTKDTKLCQKMQIPVTTHDGSTIIVKTCMHNLGQKNVSMATSGADDKVSVEESTLIAVTVYRDELQAEEWPKVVAQPVKYATQCLSPTDDALYVCPPWGRSWLAGRQKTHPKEARSMQYHARIKKTKLETIMRKSGQAGTYITPKRDDGMLDTAYSVIWVDASVIQVAKKILEYQEALGQVRADKVKGELTKTTRGIRCKRGVFQKLFEKIHPDQDVPSLQPVEFVYKAAPTPTGAALSDVAKWMSQQSWNGRPIKALKDKAWLIGVTQELDAEYATWNGQPVLLTAIKSKYHQKDQSVVVAGQLPSQKSSASNAKDRIDFKENIDPLQEEDPWKPYQRIKAGLSAGPVQQNPPAVARAVDPPIAAKFQHHEEKFAKIEDALLKMQKENEAQSNWNVHFERKVDADLQKNRRDIETQLHTMAANFDKSLEAALKKHDTQISAGFDEIKALMKEQKEQKKPPKKKHKKGEGENGEAMKDDESDL
eukprot:Skav207002  [mRNA]  locus=scaffold1939:4278:6200:- [translate_table: standard]